MKSIFPWLLITIAAHASNIQVDLKVVDENGLPLPTALTTIQCRAINSEEPNEFTGETNHDGKFCKKVESWSGLYLEAKKEGYYTARLYDQPDETDLTQEIILPRRINPRPLYVKFYNANPDRGLQIPKIDEWYKYDLKAGDWLTPHGKGTEADLRMRISFPKDPNEMQLELSAVDTNGGFVAPARLLKYSELKMPHNAPANGYQKTLTLTTGEDPMDTALFIRSRVETDAKGKIVSANYGKIQGPVLINRRGTVAFTHYFNPNANDPNLEFDPSQNLIDDSANPPQLAP